MEFAVHQPLKIYSGGLGFLAGLMYEVLTNYVRIQFSSASFGNTVIMTRRVIRIRACR
ncbi:MAG: hypothetical protein WDM78_04110 [Puia sp.]